MQKKITLYPAAALFNARETFFNCMLIEEIEKRGISTRFPQRDGFEFGHLTEILQNKLPAPQIPDAVRKIIYVLDIGKYIPECNVILPNFDEPLDPGVDIEVAYAKMMGKFSLGFRTDVRSVYGEGDLKGMHFFPAYQCNAFFTHYMPCKTPETARWEMRTLVDKIEYILDNSEIPDSHAPHSESVLQNPPLGKIFAAATQLFDGILDIHTLKGLEEIAFRYIKNKPELESIGPKIIGII